MALWLTVAPVLPLLPLPLLGEVSQDIYGGTVRNCREARHSWPGFLFSQSDHCRVVSQAFVVSRAGVTAAKGRSS